MPGEETEIQEIVRIAGTDVNGKKSIAEGIKDVKGVGNSISKGISRISEIETTREIGSLNDDEIESLEDIIENPGEHGMPSYLFNRRKDRETGEDKHLLSGDLEMAQEFDIRRMKKINSYKGVRHERGLPVRGQKTQSSFRTGEKVGVSRKEIKAQAEEEREEEEETEEE